MPLDDAGEAAARARGARRCSRVGGARAAPDRRALHRRDQPRSRGRGRGGRASAATSIFRLNGITLAHPAAARAPRGDRAARARPSSGRPAQRRRAARPSLISAEARELLRRATAGPATSASCATSSSAPSCCATATSSCPSTCPSRKCVPAPGAVVEVVALENPVRPPAPHQPRGAEPAAAQRPGGDCQNGSGSSTPWRPTSGARPGRRAALKMSRRTLISKLDRYGIPRPQKGQREEGAEKTKMGETPGDGGPENHPLAVYAELPSAADLRPAGAGRTGLRGIGCVNRSSAGHAAAISEVRRTGRR